MENSKEYYSRIGRIWCPALKDYVSFNSVGFRHLLRKKGVLRAGGDQRRRFNLLVDAVRIVKDPEVTFEHKSDDALHRIHRNGEGILVFSKVDFWKLVRREPDKMITVVIRQFEGGAKHFLSVYAKKQKSAQ
jgi:hypothetical protein